LSIMSKNIYWCSCKVPIFLVRFWGNPNYLDRLLKKKSVKPWYYTNHFCLILRGSIILSS